MKTRIGDGMCMFLIDVVIEFVCLLNDAFMHYMCVSWRKAMDGRSKGIKLCVCMCVCIVGE